MPAANESGAKPRVNPELNDPADFGAMCVCHHNLGDHASVSPFKCLGQGSCVAQPIALGFKAGPRCEGFREAQ